MAKHEHARDRSFGKVANWFGGVFAKALNTPTFDGFNAPEPKLDTRVTRNNQYSNFKKK